MSGVTGLILILLLSACQSPYSAYQQRPGYITREVQGAAFRHRLVEKPARGRYLHVYLEGDGRPWRSRYQVALDPTPPQLLMLDLMAGDAAPSLYLGRPCYLQVDDPVCQFLWWTHQRYAEAVVASLDAVLDQYAEDYAGFYLFGHSGGGTLAMLLAARRTDVPLVVTLAGNLDTQAWVQLHAYSPLEGSLNPADQPLAESIQQWHYVGSEDEVIPADLLATSVVQGQNVHLQVIEGIDHQCCWQQYWQEILAEINEKGSDQQ